MSKSYLQSLVVHKIREIGHEKAAELFGVSVQLVKQWENGSKAISLSAVEKVFDLTPRGIITALGLKAPIYRQTAAHGHFGRAGFPWEETSKVGALKEAVSAAV